MWTKANTSEVSGFVNDSWSCLAVWFYKNKYSSEIRSHNQVQGDKSRREKLKISKIFLDKTSKCYFFRMKIFLVQLEIGDKSDL